MEKCINVEPVPYWRNDKYRIMCNFWVKHFFNYCKEYDYVMRIDDDSIIEEPITEDMFAVYRIRRKAEYKLIDTKVKVDNTKPYKGGSWRLDNDDVGDRAELRCNKCDKITYA